MPYYRVICLGNILGIVINFTHLKSMLSYSCALYELDVIYKAKEGCGIDIAHYVLQNIQHN